MTEERFTSAPEQYEFTEAPPYRFEVDRREFFKLLGCGVLVFLVGGAADAQESGGGGRRRGGGQRPGELGAWLHVAEDGTVSVFTGKAEVGQNIRTSLTQAVADELRAPISLIRMVMADTALVPTTPELSAAAPRRICRCSFDASLQRRAKRCSTLVRLPSRPNARTWRSPTASSRVATRRSRYTSARCRRASNSSPR